MNSYAEEVDHLSYSITYTPCLKITILRPLIAVNDEQPKAFTQLTMPLNIKAPFVSKYCLPKGEYIVKVFPKCDPHQPAFGVNTYQTSDHFWLSLLTNFGRVITTEKNTETWSSQYGRHLYYYDIKGKYYIHMIGFQGQLSNEHEIVQLEPLLNKMPTWFVSCLDMKTTDDWQPLLEEFNKLERRNKELEDLLL